MPTKRTLKVLIKNTEGKIFEGQADRVTSFNEVGRFDVLPMHANFISMINHEVSIFRNHEKVKDLKINQAIMKVKQDSVKIFLGIELFDLSGDFFEAKK